MKSFFATVLLTVMTFMVSLARGQAGEAGWRDQEGRAVSLEEWSEHPIALAMAYTSCRTACPLLVRRLKAQQKQLKEKQGITEFVLVSLDPEHDTVEQLRAFMVRWELGPHWHFLLGSPGETQKLARRLGLNVFEDEGHLMHESKVFLVSAASAPGGSSLSELRLQ